MAYHFPPENAVGGLRPYRFYKYLSEAGFRCRVITAAEQPSGPDDSIECIPDRFDAGGRRDAAWQAERAVRRFLLPGMVGTGWSARVFDAACRLIQSNPSARFTVVSSYPPLGAHLAGWRLSRELGVRWIADFRDPLAGNPSHSPYYLKYQESICQFLESAFIRAADGVIANTDAVAEKWRVKFPALRDRIHLIWNGFDPEDPTGPLPLPARGFRLFSHTGELYQGRSIAGVLESVSRLIDAGRLTAAEFRIHLAGYASPSSLPPEGLMERARADGWLEIQPRQIPQAEARGLMRTSDGLLLVQPQSRVQVPGKLFEYIQTGRPILAYVPRDTPIERILAGSGVPHRCVYSGSPVDEFDAAVESFFSMRETETPANDWFNSNFDARRQTAALSRLIRGDGRE